MPDVRDKTLSEHLEEFIEIAPHNPGLAELTIRQYAFWVRHFIAWTEEQTGHTAALDDFNEELLLRHSNARCVSHGYRPRAVNVMHSAYRSFGLWLVKQKRLPANPGLALDMVKMDEAVRVVATDHEADAMIDACRWLPNQTKIPLYTAVIALLRCSGLRTSEMAALRLQDLDIAAKRLTVVRGKGGKRRDVWLSSEGVAQLVAYLKTRPTDCQHDFLLAANRRHGVSTKGIAAIIDTVQAVARIPRDRRLTVHSFRHRFATTLLDQQVNYKTISALLGHAQVSTTMNIYAHTDEDRMRAAVELTSTRARHPDPGPPAPPVTLPVKEAPRPVNPLRLVDGGEK